MGLLGSFFSNPEQQGLLGITTGLLNAGGPSRLPVGFGQAVSQGLQQGTQNFNATTNANLARDYTQAQVNHLTNTDALTRLQVEQMAQDQEIQKAVLQRLGLLPGSTPAPVAPGPVTPGAIPPGATKPPPPPPVYQSPVITNPGANAPFGVPVTSPSAPAIPTASVAPSLPAGVPVSSAPNAPSGVTGIPAALQLPIGLDFAFNKGRNAGTMMAGYSKPTDRQKEALSLGLVPGTPAYNAYVGTQYNQGGAWQIDPITGGVRLATGYAQGMGQVKNAEEAARARYDLVSVPVGPNGQTQLMPRIQAAAILGDNRASALPAVQPNGQQAPRIGYSPSPADLEFQKALASDMEKSYATILNAGVAAPKSVLNYQRLGSLLAQVGTGKFRGTTLQIKALAKSAGIDLGALGISDDVAPAQAAQALSAQLALELRNPAGGAGMPGSMSNQDRAFLQSMVPSLENAPAAIPLMIDFRVRLARRDEQIAQLARSYKRSHNGRFDDGFFDELQTWSDAHPLFTDADAKQVAAATGGSGTPQGYSQEDLEYTAKKYGMTVDQVKQKLGVQ